jgi:formate hydrogenlyase subunit 4
MEEMSTMQTMTIAMQAMSIVISVIAILISCWSMAINRGIEARMRRAGERDNREGGDHGQ